MKQRVGVIVGILAAFLIGAFAVAGPAQAADAGAVKLQKQVKKANKKAKKVCKKVKKAKRGKAKAKAKKRCKSAKKNATRLKKKLKKYNAAQYFDVCKHGCKYRTVQQGADAAGKWQFKNKKRTATVRVQPGVYSEGVMLRGKTKGSDFDNLQIIGVKKNKQPNPDARQVILDGTNAKTIRKGNDPTWRPGDQSEIPANNAIDAEDIDGIVLKNMWGRHYQNNTFFVWASNVAADNSHCSDFVMDNLVSSDTRSYGLFSRNCFGGKFLNSEGWNHGDSALYIGETPCDKPDWNVHGTNPGPCQANPDWTIVKNFKSHQNVLGYSGTNSKYVEIEDSAFYNNGAGIVPNTLDSEKFEPSGWMKIHDNDIFWNNYNYYVPGGEFETVSHGLAELAGEVVNYPIGAGIMLFGSSGVEVKNNNIFGNEKYGAMSFSSPGDFGANEGDDGKNMNNQFIGNKMGRDGLDPNGTDFLDDATGGGNCWSDNVGKPSVSYVIGALTQAQIYKPCPQTPVINDNVSSLNLGAKIQADLNNLSDPNTVIGYAAQSPPERMECSWLGNAHPAFTDANGTSYKEVRAKPVDCSH